MIRFVSHRFAFWQAIKIYLNGYVVDLLPCLYKSVVMRDFTDTAGRALKTRRRGQRAENVANESCKKVKLKLNRRNLFTIVDIFALKYMAVAET